MSVLRTKLKKKFSDKLQNTLYRIQNQEIRVLLVLLHCHFTIVDKKYKGIEFDQKTTVDLIGASLGYVREKKVIVIKEIFVIEVIRNLDIKELKINPNMIEDHGILYLLSYLNDSTLLRGREFEYFFMNCFYKTQNTKSIKEILSKFSNTTNIIYKRKEFDLKKVLETKLDIPSKINKLISFKNLYYTQQKSKSYVPIEVLQQSKIDGFIRQKFENSFFDIRFFMKLNPKEKERKKNAKTSCIFSPFVSKEERIKLIDKNGYFKKNDVKTFQKNKKKFKVHEEKPDIEYKIQNADKEERSFYEKDLNLIKGVIRIVVEPKAKKYLNWEYYRINKKIEESNMEKIYLDFSKPINKEVFKDDSNFSFELFCQIDKTNLEGFLPPEYKFICTFLKEKNLKQHFKDIYKIISKKGKFFLKCLLIFFVDNDVEMKDEKKCPPHNYQVLSDSKLFCSKCGDTKDV